MSSTVPIANNTFRCLTAVGSTPTLIQVGAALVGAPPMSGNLFRDLDLGLDLRTDAGGTYSITANTFFNNAEGLRFSTNQPNTPTPTVTLGVNACGSALPRLYRGYMPDQQVGASQVS